MSNCHKQGGLKVVRKNFGHGVHAKVSIVKRKSDGKLLIWKRPSSSRSVHQKAFRKEIERSKYWRKFGISNVNVCWHSDKHSLLKTYVKGKTLAQILKNNRNFFSKTRSRSAVALGKFLELLIDSRHYIQNLSCENLVFDGKKWQVIDSSNVHKRKSSSDIKQEYMNKFLGIWSRKVRSDSQTHHIKSFLRKHCN
jgi:hypothetical protein